MNLVLTHRHTQNITKLKASDVAFVLSLVQNDINFSAAPIFSL